MDKLFHNTRRLTHKIFHARGVVFAAVYPFKQGKTTPADWPWMGRPTFHAFHAFHATTRHDTPRHATPCHAMTPCHATPRHAIPRHDASPRLATPVRPISARFSAPTWPPKSAKFGQKSRPRCSPFSTSFSDRFLDVFDSQLRPAGSQKPSFFFRKNNDF